MNVSVIYFKHLVLCLFIHDSVICLLYLVLCLFIYSSLVFFNLSCSIYLCSCIPLSVCSQLSSSADIHHPELPISQQPLSFPRPLPLYWGVIENWGGMEEEQRLQREPAQLQSDRTPSAAGRTPPYPCSVTTDLLELYKECWGGIHRQEMIKITWLRSRNPGFLVRFFLYSWTVL